VSWIGKRFCELIKNLENKGLVERIQSKDNKKHIEIVL